MAAQRQTIPSRNEAPPPAPREWLPKEVRAEWDHLWEAGASTLWKVGDHDAVARLAYLRTQYHAHGDTNVDTLARLHPQITKLEGSLLLTPESQVRAGIRVEDPQPERTEEQQARRADAKRRLRSVG